MGLGGCLEGVERLSGGHEGLSGGFGRPSGGCGDDVCCVWGGYLEGV